MEREVVLRQVLPLLPNLVLIVSGLQILMVTEQWTCSSIIQVKTDLKIIKYICQAILPELWLHLKQLRPGESCRRWIGIKSRFGILMVTDWPRLWICGMMAMITWIIAGMVLCIEPVPEACQRKNTRSASEISMVTGKSICCWLVGIIRNGVNGWLCCRPGLNLRDIISLKNSRHILRIYMCVIWMAMVAMIFLRLIKHQIN